MKFPPLSKKVKGNLALVLVIVIASSVISMSNITTAIQTNKSVERQLRKVGLEETCRSASELSCIDFANDMQAYTYRLERSDWLNYSIVESSDNVLKSLEEAIRKRYEEGILTVSEVASRSGITDTNTITALKAIPDSALTPSNFKFSSLKLDWGNGSNQLSDTEGIIALEPIEIEVVSQSHDGVLRDLLTLDGLFLTIFTNDEKTEVIGRISEDPIHSGFSLVRR